MKRLPKHIKEQQGTLEKSREPESPLTFKPLSRIPKPRLKNESEIEYYNYFCNILLVSGLLTAADIPYIQSKMIWFRLHDEAVKNIDDENYYQTSDKSGWSQVNGHVQMLERCAKYIGEFCSKYGLTLVDRQKIDLTGIKNNNDNDLLSD